MLKEILMAVGLVPSIPDDQIIAAMDPWTLACAVGAENGTVGVHIGFETWLLLSRGNWMAAVVTSTGAAESRIEAALLAFVSANKAQHMNSVLREQETKRGLPHVPVLGPGESMTVSISGRVNPPSA